METYLMILVSGFTKFQTIQFSISTQFFVYTQLNDQTVLFQKIYFSWSFNAELCHFDKSFKQFSLI